MTRLCANVRYVFIGMHFANNSYPRCHAFPISMVRNRILLLLERALWRHCNPYYCSIVSQNTSCLFYWYPKHPKLVAEVFNVIHSLLHSNRLNPNVLISTVVCRFDFQIIGAQLTKIMMPDCEHQVCWQPA